jgi:hypothetical protein
MTTLNVGEPSSTSYPGGSAPSGAARHASAESLGIREVATLLLDVLPAIADAMCEHILATVPGLKDTDELRRATRIGCEANVREILVMQRAQLPASAFATQVDAGRFARFLQSRGIGVTPTVDAYKHGLAFFHRVVEIEFDQQIADPLIRERARTDFHAFVFEYIGHVTATIAAEYGLPFGWRPDTDDAAFLDDPSAKTAAATLRTRAEAAGRWVSPESASSRGHADAAAELAWFTRTIEEAARHPHVCSRLNKAAGSFEIVLSDEPDLSVTVMFNRAPVTVEPGGASPQGRIWLPSTDLRRFGSADYHVAMSVTRGRIQIEGPVRGLLRVMPMIRQIVRDSPRRWT